MIRNGNYKEIDIRNFFFENELGQRINCQSVVGNLFLYNITGLGFEKNIEYVRVGNTFVKNKEEFAQNVIDGELEFYNMTYDEYISFVNFILQANNLKLIYIPKRKNRVEFFREIDLVKIDKNEEDDYNTLVSPITIYCKSLWNKANNIKYDVKSTENEIRWDFKWDSKFSDYEHRNVTIENKGHVAAPFLLEIEGYVENPSISIYVDDILQNELTLDLILEEGEKLQYCTQDNNLYIQKNSNGTVTNLFNLLDLNNSNNFFKIPLGVSTIKLNADTDIENANLTVYEQYITV